MVFKKQCILVLWTKVASAVDRLIRLSHLALLPTYERVVSDFGLQVDGGLTWVFRLPLRLTTSLNMTQKVTNNEVLNSYTRWQPNWQEPKHKVITCFRSSGYSQKNVGSPNKPLYNPVRNLLPKLCQLDLLTPLTYVAYAWSDTWQCVDNKAIYWSYWSESYCSYWQSQSLIIWKNVFNWKSSSNCKKARTMLILLSSRDLCND